MATTRNVRDVLARKWDDFLNSSAKRLFPNYFDRVMPLKERVGVHRLQSSSPLQILLYYNSFIVAPFCIIMAAGFLWKTKWFQRRFWNFAQDWVFLFVFMIIEPIRINLGFRGNLRARVPDLAAMCLLSIFQFVFTGSFLLFQQTCGFGITTPLEFGINIIYVVLIVLEIILGYLGGKRIAIAQTNDFFSEYEYEGINSSARNSNSLLTNNTGPYVPLTA